MKLSYHGHSIIALENNGSKVLVDPFINGNELTDLIADEVETDYIVLTHGHNDHVGDTVDIAKRNNATVIAPVELADYIGSKDIEVVAMNIGGRNEFEFGSVKFVHAFHSSSYTFDDGSWLIYTGMPTGIFVDMNIKSERNGPFDVFFVPIGDNFTSGIDEAAYATDNLVKPGTAVPVHYNTFPPIEQDPQEFKDKLSTDCQVLTAGDEVKI